MKIGARVPQIKPGRQTIEYLTKVQQSTRFWGEFLSPYFYLYISLYLKRLWSFSVVLPNA